MASSDWLIFKYFGKHEGKHFDNFSEPVDHLYLRWWKYGVAQKKQCRN